ncbi:MAG TPA: YdcF family protein [Verrucomicrobiae bacterium]|nr:YdcF family protein [Verrucomicrobiae bacterium]
MAVLFTLIVLLAVVALLYPQKFLCVDSGPVRADVVVVLGGGSHDRPERAAELFKQRVAPRILVSGLGDCTIYRRSLIQAGVPAQAIQMEDRSRTTRENAIFAIDLLRRQGARRVIIVTSWYHSRRALACFEHYGPEVQFYSCPSYVANTRPDWVRHNLAHRIYLEYPKLLGYWMCYGISPF